MNYCFLSSVPHLLEWRIIQPLLTKKLWIRFLRVEELISKFWCFSKNFLILPSFHSTLKHTLRDKETYRLKEYYIYSYHRRTFSTVLTTSRQPPSPPWSSSWRDVPMFSQSIPFGLLSGNWFPCFVIGTLLWGIWRRWLSLSYCNSIKTMTCFMWVDMFVLPYQAKLCRANYSPDEIFVTKRKIRYLCPTKNFAQ